MIKVGFVLAFLDQSWIGGLNYYKSLLNAIHELPDGKLEPVLFIGASTPESLLKDFPPAARIRLSCLSRWSASWMVRKLLQRLSGHDILLERQLKRYGISVLSHCSQPLGMNSMVTTLGWIPDFQHMRLPEFFDETERATRDLSFREICTRCDRVLLSSFAAQEDLKRFMPACLQKSRVLQFVSNVADISKATSERDICEKYGIEGAYLHLPNQFWRHKNHQIVIDALYLLKQRNKAVTVVCTGNTVDHRHPEYFEALMRHVAEYGLLDSFRVLGVVPYADLLALMKGAAALLNPSLFEGWSTTVEEAKALGKKIVLSNIDVHLEQAPSGGRYFDPHDAEALATLLEEIMADMGEDHPASQQEMQASRRAFAENYQCIVLDALQHAGVAHHA